MFLKLYSKINFWPIFLTIRLKKLARNSAMSALYCKSLWLIHIYHPVGVVEEPIEEEDGETIGCDADSLDSAIDPEEHKAQDFDDGNGEYIESIVFKGKRIKKGSGHHSLHSHHFSSVGNLLQVGTVLQQVSIELLEAKKH